MKSTAGKQPKPKTECFTWTGDEVELLLKVTNEAQSTEKHLERRLAVSPVEVWQERQKTGNHSDQERSHMEPSVCHFGYSRSSGLAPGRVYLDDVTVFR